MSSGPVRRVSREDIQLVSWSSASPGALFLFLFPLFDFINENDCLNIQFYLLKIVSPRLGVIQINMLFYGASHFLCHFLHWWWCCLTLSHSSLFLYYFNLTGKRRTRNNFLNSYLRKNLNDIQYIYKMIFYGSDESKMERILCS
jgi:hypothetical protein